jgi:superfamily I DNA and/or RNA helicase
MFSIANKIAYNDKMVFGPSPEEEIETTKTRPLLGYSRWIDVQGEDFEDHYSPAEGQAVLNLIVDYQRQGLSTAGDGLPELYVISPFKSVATAMTELLSEHTSVWATDVAEKSINEWLGSHVGTVHTFQGKESEMVIFVLGGKTAGARSWSASRPNIINVAVTRAKRRLYVIGNVGAWMSTPFGAALYNGFDMRSEEGRFNENVSHTA